MANSQSIPERSTYRTVILLRKSDKLKLERMAAKQKVSSAEVVRRFIRSGERILKNQQEDELIEAALKIIAQAVSEANESLIRSIDTLDRLHLQLQKNQN